MSRRSFNDPHGRSGEARAALLANRCEHRPKNHRTTKRAKALAKKKRQAAAHRRAVNDAARARKLKAARAYWRGEREGHP